MRIKICGLSRPCDIGFVNEAKPDWCGFIINFPRSRRNVSLEQVRELSKKLDPSVVPVGVFVDQPVEFAAAALNRKFIRIAQLHGHEDSSYISALRSLAPGCPVWKAFRVRTAEDLEQAAACSADLVLLDNGYGTGECFNWSLLDSFPRPYLLAGGLTLENIPDAAAQLHPYGIDISSGVETDGFKDRDKILAAVAAARKDSLIP
ncbi:MAG: phosphoribosylanthranilate isomerase [Oscillospiraceae bacterium]|nr:phosphoribosylanthranilate isomerase [Oscillospiraceae bacterium]